LIASVVVPTRNEAGNIEPLVDRLTKAVPAGSVEIIFVDDSDDGTNLVIRDLMDRSETPIHLIHRAGAERTGGLGGAVVEGFKIAKAPWICVMDADLQHPPESVYDLLRRSQADDVDMIVGSRYCDEGTMDEFGPIRTAISKVSTAAASMMFPRNLRRVTDPMSGFFMVRRQAVEIETLEPKGFKILLEILVRHPDMRVAEVPFDFGSRLHGETKASPLEAVRLK
jgi:dolichol-phosphate mannosyltransferase